MLSHDWRMPETAHALHGCSDNVVVHRSFAYGLVTIWLQSHRLARKSLARARSPYGSNRTAALHVGSRDRSAGRSAAATPTRLKMPRVCT